MAEHSQSELRRLAHQTGLVAELDAEVERLREALERFLGYMDGQTACCCCGERLTLESPQKGHAPECAFLALEDALVPEGD